MLTPRDALTRILGQVEPLPSEQVALPNAHLRVAARPLLATEAAPRFDNSAMDGYAVRAADTVSASPAAPVTLALGGHIAAGANAAALEPGTAARIFTGAPLPGGADAVVMQEDVVCNDGRVILTSPVPPGCHVRWRGEDIRPGQVLIGGGEVLRAGELGALAAQGITLVDATRRPQVAVLCTGNELIAPSEAPSGSQVRNSNGAMLTAQAAAAGALVELVGQVQDDDHALAQALLAAARRAQVVVTSGGASVGEHDHLAAALARVGKVELHKVAIKPGKPMLFGRIEDALVFGLPGNPVSAFVCFELFVRPALRRMSGAAAVERPRLAVRLDTELRRHESRWQYVTARLSAQDGALSATALARQGSGNQSTIVGVDALLEVAPGAGRIAAGELVTALLLGPPRPG